jgi:hypothetical protein
MVDVSADVDKREAEETRGDAAAPPAERAPQQAK